jgi:hypothetical protein
MLIFKEGAGKPENLEKIPQPHNPPVVRAREHITATPPMPPSNTKL